MRLATIIYILILSTVAWGSTGITTLVVHGVEVKIMSPKNEVTGEILLLPGWNFPAKMWADSTDFCDEAVKRGYRIIMPEMGKSIYASQYFSETRKDWRREPSINWVTDSLLPFLEKEKLFITQRKFLCGLSTGARGVVLIAEKTNHYFKGGAALSGDYNPLTMTWDNLQKVYYGEYKTHKERWQTTDNATNQIRSLKIPVYFGHGTKDKVVPYSQTKDFYTLLKKNSPTNSSVFHSADAGHNFTYWNSETMAILNFFDDIRQ